MCSCKLGNGFDRNVNTILVAFDYVCSKCKALASTTCSTFIWLGCCSAPVSGVLMEVDCSPFLRGV